MASYIERNPNQYTIFSYTALVFILALSIITVCDAQSSLEISPSDANSLDLPPIDAYNLGPSSQDNFLLAPSPISKAPLSSPSNIAPSPYQPSPAHNEPTPMGPHNGPTGPFHPGSPRRSRAPDYAVWCVARPTVPEPLLQRAMDYACGNGADCGSIRPNGPCFVPNTLVAHASYAFNSYWQRTKVLGGTCDFGATAMLVTVDPSFSGCHYMYT